MSTLREILTAEVEIITRFGHGLMQSLVLKHGVDGTPVKHRHKLHREKQCFKNATDLALYHGLAYVEGYALRPGLFPTQHAWNVDDAGGVIDVTWRKPDDCEYLGIKFPTETLRREILRNKVYGLLDLGVGLNIELLREIDNDLVESFINQKRRA